MSEALSPALAEQLDAPDPLNDSLADRNIPIFNMGEGQLVIAYDFLSAENRAVLETVFPDSHTASDGEHTLLVFPLETEGLQQAVDSLVPQSLAWLAIDTSEFEEFDPTVQGWFLAHDGRVYPDERIGMRQNAWLQANAAQAAQTTPELTPSRYGTVSGKPVIQEQRSRGIQNITVSADLL